MRLTYRPLDEAASRGCGQLAVKGLGQYTITVIAAQNSWEIGTTYESQAISANVAASSHDARAAERHHEGQASVRGVEAAVRLRLRRAAFAQAPRGGAAAGGAGPKASGGGGKDEGYGYEFSDDPLAAGGFGPNDATIRVRPGPVRTTLIRPRTSFVPEMLKSVENL